MRDRDRDGSKEQREPRKQEIYEGRWRQKGSAWTSGGASQRGHISTRVISYADALIKTGHKDPCGSTGAAMCKLLLQRAYNMANPE